MAKTRDELLREALRTIKELEIRVGVLEQRQSEQGGQPELQQGWDEPMDTAESVQADRQQTQVLNKKTKEPFVVEFQMATQEQIERRNILIDQGLFTGNKSYENAEMIEAYETAGPLWLHAYDRDFVLSLPIGTRQQMCQDVALTSPDDAKRLSADILKAGSDDRFMHTPLPQGEWQ